MNIDNGNDTVSRIQIDLDASFVFIVLISRYNQASSARAQILLYKYIFNSVLVHRRTDWPDSQGVIKFFLTIQIKYIYVRS